MMLHDSDKKTILVVEDESIVAMDIKSRLGGLGYTVVGAVPSGAEALVIASQQPLDLILMDIHLQGDWDGIQTAKKINEIQNVPIIYMTAFADKETISRAKTEETFAYILKPFQEREVAIAIEMALYKQGLNNELKAARNMMNASLNAMEDAVLVLDSESIIRFANTKAFEFAAAHDSTDILGKSVQELFSFNENPALDKILSHSYQHSDDSRKYASMQSPSGKRPVLLIQTPLSTEQSNTLLTKNVQSGTVFFIKDMSTVLESLRTQSRLMGILDSSQDAIISVDLELKILSWNAGAVSIYGYTEAEMIGYSFAKLFNDDRSLSYLSKFIKKLSDKREEPVRVTPLFSTRVRNDTKNIFVYSTITPLPDENGALTELCFVERDVTTHKEHLDNLELAKKSAEEADKIKSEFISNVSHELRTPLNSILGTLSLLSENEIEAGLSEPIGIISQSAEKLRQLIDSVLEFSTLERGGRALLAINFDIVDLIIDTVHKVVPEAIANDVQLNITYDVKMFVKFNSDPEAIIQIVLSLLSNAIKFSRGGDVSVYMETVTENKSNNIYWKLSVTDTGIGIPNSEKDTIWKPFTQLDASKTRTYGGIGTGLSLVKALCEKLHGSVSLSSEEGNGSTFNIQIPVQITDISERAVTKMSVYSKYHIYLAGFLELQMSFYKNVFTACGAYVTACKDEKEFLAVLKNRVRKPMIIIVSNSFSVSKAVFEWFTTTQEGMECSAALVVLRSLCKETACDWTTLSEHIPSFQSPLKRRYLDSLPEIVKQASEKTLPTEKIKQYEDIVSKRHTKDTEVLQEIESNTQVKEILARLIVIGEKKSLHDFSEVEQALLSFKDELTIAGAPACSRMLFRMILAARRRDAETIKTYWHQVHNLVEHYLGSKP